MNIKLLDRIQECSEELRKSQSELNDYNMIMMCIKALQMTAQYPNKFTSTTEDYNKVVEKLHNLCAKHEIQLPSDYIEWSSIDIV